MASVEAVTLVVMEQSLRLKLPRALFEAGMASCPVVFLSSPWVLATATVSAAQFPLLLTRPGVQVGMPALSSSFLPALIRKLRSLRGVAPGWPGARQSRPGGKRKAARPEGPVLG